MDPTPCNGDSDCSGGLTASLKTCNDGYCACPINTYIDNSNANTGCTPCPGTSTSDGTAVHCTQCGDTSGPGNGNHQCVDVCTFDGPCAGVAQYCDTAGAKCVCPEGFHKSNAVSGCTACPPDTVSDGLLPVRVCKHCPSGKIPNGNASACMCAPGQDNTSKSPCAACPPGTVSDGSGGCETCTAGTVANASGTACECGPGQQGTPYAGCERCPSGSVSPGGAACVACRRPTVPDASHAMCVSFGDANPAAAAWGLATVLLIVVAVVAVVAWTARTRARA